MKIKEHETKTIIDFEQKVYKKKGLQKLNKSEINSVKIIPNNYKKVSQCQNSIYNMRISEDGIFLYIATQTSLIIYKYNMKDQEYIQIMNKPFFYIQWTITDLDLSDNQQLIVHSSLNPYLGLFDTNQMKYNEMININENNNNSINLDENNSENSDDYSNSTRLSSIRFNQDNSYILCGSHINQNKNEKSEIYLYDLTKKKKETIKGHYDDINSVTFLNRKENDNIFLSGGDDGLILIWDKRILGIKRDKAIGKLVGHHSGVTYISSRQDEIYIASNGKDNMVKLWDIRLKLEQDKKSKLINIFHDYRFKSLNEQVMQQIYFINLGLKYVHNYRHIQQQQNEEQKIQHQYQQQYGDKHTDVSVHSYFGHKVEYTLIRCHFSPMNFNGSRYIASGSACGKLFIWDILTNQKVKELQTNHTHLIRDFNWHPNCSSILTGNHAGQLVQWYYSQSYLYNHSNTYLNTYSHQQ